MSSKQLPKRQYPKRHPLTRLRVCAGLSQSELARRAHVRQQNISLYERGLRAPKQKNIARLARALACSPHEIDDSILELFSSDLELVIRAWPNLSPAQRRRILAYARPKV